MMQDNLGLVDMLFNVDSVMVSINDSEPTEHIEITPIEGSMVGYKFVIGDFVMTDKTHDNGDGEVKFEVSFLDVDEDTNNLLIAEHHDTINSIAEGLIKKAIEEFSETHGKE